MVDSRKNEQRIKKLAEQYAQKRKQGETPSHQEVLAANVDIADELRTELRRIDLLLDAFEAPELRADNTLEKKTRQDVDSTTPPKDAEIRQPNTTTTQIGRYKLLQLIGVGGMGEVWMAEQEKPVRRRVALKLIKDGSGNKEVLARFEAERQALAMMDHQNIAKVLDAGATADGAPYVVMELVQGIPINQYCDRNKLNPDQRLELFVPVCKAVQHAHQKGIIHRDLKPSNVLVQMFDGKPVAKVIDFGLAKALQHQIKLTDKTMFTQFGQVVGTPQYMSPEQATMDAMNVDTRTDVYSLGVMLYELLAGSTPIDQDTIRKNAVLRVLDMIREQEPPRPSQRLSSSGDNIRTIAEHRRIQPTKLQQILQGELDWIVMKALEKDRVRRYETASSLADDIRRYLDGDAVEARPPSTAYKLSKFVNKNRGFVATATTVFVLLVAGIVGTSFGFYRASQSAKRSADMLQIVTDSFGSTNPEKGSTVQMTAKDVLVNAHESMKASELDDLGKAELLFSLTTSFLSIGDDALAISTAEEYWALAKEKFGPDHAKSLTAMHHLAACYRAAGRSKEALELQERTRALMTERLGTEHPDTLRANSNLAIDYSEAGRINEALELQEKTLELMKKALGIDHTFTMSAMSGLAYIYNDAGRTEEALALQEETLELKTENLGPDHPSTLSSMHGLANIYDAAGQTGKALELREKTFKLTTEKLGPGHADTLSAMSSLANSYEATGRTEEALKLRKKTLELTTEKLGPYHANTLSAMNNLAISYDRAGRSEEALELREKALDLMIKTLDPGHPHTLSAMNNLAISYERVGRSEEALELQEKTLSLMTEKLGHDHRDTLRSMINLALSYCRVGRIVESLQMIEETLDQQTKKLGLDQQDTLKSKRILAAVLWECNKRIEQDMSSGEFLRAEKLLKAMAAHHGPHTKLVRDVPQRLHAVRLAQRKWSDGLDSIDDWLEQINNEAIPDQESVTNAMASQAVCLLELGKRESAEDVAREALDNDTITSVSRRRVEGVLAVCLAHEEKFEEAETLAVEAYEELETMLDQLPVHLRWYTPRAAERVIKVYELWEKREKINEWQTRLAEIQTQIAGL